MLPFKTLIIIEETSRIAIYRQIADRLIVLIQEGVIQPGTFLPSSREMASLLERHRKTVIAAYEELIIQDWIETLPRKGIRVAVNLPQVKPKSFTEGGKNQSYTGAALFSFRNNIPGANFNHSEVKKTSLIVNDGFPDASLAPFDGMIKEYRKLLQGAHLTRLMSSRDFGGTPALKESACNFLNDSRGLNISSDNILMTRGAQMAIYVAASLIIKPGDHVLVSDPSYFIADELFRQLGANLIRIPVDGEGMDVDAIEDALKNNRISLLYIIPHHHHPTTVTMSPSRRTQVLALIREYQLPVIEDDYDYDFHYHNSPVLPLASADHDGNVLYIGSFTKLLSPSFRIGYLVGRANFIAQAINMKRLIDLRGDTMMEEALSVMITNGEIDRHIKKSKKIYSERCDLISNLFNDNLSDVLSFTKPQGGLALWLKFKDKYPLAEVIARASSAGLVLSGSAYHLGEDKKHNGLRFGFATLNEVEMQRAVDILRKITIDS